MNGRLAIAGALGAVMATLGATVCVVLGGFLGLPPLVGGVSALVGGLLLGCLAVFAAALLPSGAEPRPSPSPSPSAPLGPIVSALRQLGTGRATQLGLEDGDGPPDLVAAVRSISNRMVEDRRSAIAREAELRDSQHRTAALLRHVEAELEQLDTREKASSRVRDEFLTRMSHELRTPLNAILGYVEMLEEEAEDPDAKADLGRVRSSALNLLAIVTTVLDLTQLQSGSYEIVPEQLDLTALVGSVAESVQVEAEANGNRLEVSVQPGIEAYLDRRMVQSILFNLAANGCKYTANGSVKLGVHTHGQRVRLSVADSGIGMTPRQIEEAFRPFDQADGATTRRYDGAGLGLAVVRGFAEAMGGTVSIDSTLGAGATVTVELPPRVLPRAPGEGIEEDEPTMLLR